MAVKEKSTTNVPVPKPVHRRAKRFAERHGRILQSVAGEALVEYLDKREQKTPQPHNAAENGQT